VVEGSDRIYPILSGLPERFFLIKHAELGEGNEIISINGQTNPLVDIRPGEMQFWRITHIGATLSPDRKVFMIDHHVMEEDRVDQTVKLGDTEEWTVINTDQQFHSFHIHQTGFLVTEVNGVPQHELGLRDTVSIPPATDQSQGVLKVVIPFTDPVITGRFVCHCHAVDHEDKGMMGVIEVVA
jgi:hypothetical protein